MGPISLMLYCTLFFNFVNILNSTPKSGPYRTVVTRAGTCKKPSYPLHKNSPLNLDIQLYNTSTRSFLIRGNLTATRNVANVKSKMKSYLWVNGKWKVNYMVDSFSCKQRMVPMLCSLFNVKFNQKRCLYLKGHYHFENFDPNDILHIISKTLEYGRTLWVSEMYIPGTPFQTLNCQETESVIVPI